MDFLEHQKKARGRSKKLYWIFPMAVLLVATGVWVVLRWSLWLLLPGTAAVSENSTAWEPVVESGQQWLGSAQFMFWTIGIVMAVIFVSSLWKMFSLRGGGMKVASLMHGIPISHESSSHERRQLLNVVEEMSIASGMPVPPVFVIDSRSLNALAAGWTPEDAVIVVTQGLVDRLSRDEMQGVIAHEFSHIVHGDIRINSRLVGVIHGIMVVGGIGRCMIRAPYRDGEFDEDTFKALPIMIILMIIGFFIMVVGSIGTLVGRVIQSAVSRQREYLADAAAVDFTRNPDGIAGALRKIGARGSRNQLGLISSSEFAHFFFTNPVSGWLSTHPPLEHRIARIERVPVEDIGRITTVGGGGPGVSAGIELGIACAGLQQLGEMTPSATEHARSLMDQLPRRLADSIHTALGAQAAIVGLLYDPEFKLQRKQRSMVSSRLGAPVTAEIKAIHPYLIAMDRVQELLILDLSVPALARLNRFETERLLQVVELCIEVDERTDLFEWIVGRIILRRLRLRLSLHVSREGRRTLAQVGSSAACAVYAVARRGAREEAAADAAYAAGIERLGVALPVPDRSAMSLEGLGKAFDELGEAALEVRVAILESCLVAAANDGMIRTGEYEMIRAVADALGIGMPPILPGKVKRSIPTVSAK
jgi:Zn-dependent protease with chaperone function